MTSYLITVSDKDEAWLDQQAGNGIRLYTGGMQSAGVAVVGHIEKIRAKAPGTASIDVWPWRVQAAAKPGQRVYSAAADAADQDCSRHRAGRVTWLTMGAEKVAAIVPAQAAERWLGDQGQPDPACRPVCQRRQAVEAKVPPYQHIYGATHQHGLDQSVRQHDHLDGAMPHVHDAQTGRQLNLPEPPRDFSVTFRRGAPPEYRTKTGRLLTEAEVRAYACEAEQGYEVVRPATVRKIAELLSHLGGLTDAPGVLGRGAVQIERWLRS